MVTSSRLRRLDRLYRGGRFICTERRILILTPDTSKIEVSTSVVMKWDAVKLRFARVILFSTRSVVFMKNSLWFQHYQEPCYITCWIILIHFPCWLSIATLNVFATPFNPLTQICSLTVTFNGVGGDVLYPTVCASIGSAVDSMSLCHDLPSLLIGINVEISNFRSFSI